MTSLPRACGVFVTGTDTEVGKTYVATAIVKSLRKASETVGVYKPIASGCIRVRGELVSEDAKTLWEAADRPGRLAEVCPQRFVAPLAPHIAAADEGGFVDEELLFDGIRVWNRYSFVVVEGAGGLLSPLGPTVFNADLAQRFDLPLIVVAANRLGVLNHTLMTLESAVKRRLRVLGVVLNDVTERSDLSSISNREQLREFCWSEFSVPLIGHLKFGQQAFDEDLDWRILVQGPEFPDS